MRRTVAAKLVRDWHTEHPKIRFFDAARIARWANRLTKKTMDLLDQELTLLVAEGHIQVKYMLRSPQGDLLGSAVDDQAELPDTIPDRFHTYYFDKDECDIVTGYRFIS